MKVARKSKDANFLVPFIQDEVTKVNISPEHLPHYGGEGVAIETDAAYQELEYAQTAEEFYKAVAILVFHARHLSPVEHANLARLISEPVKRGRGRPKNTKLKSEAHEHVLLSSSSLFKDTYSKTRFVNADLANRNKTSKEVSRRAVREAKDFANSKKMKPSEA